MPQLIITPKAAAGLEKCRDFLEQKNPRAAQRAAEIIKQKFQLLQSQPHIGRPCEIEPLRELIIPFGNAAYVTLYRYEQDKDIIFILAFRHGKEVGY